MEAVTNQPETSLQQARLTKGPAKMVGEEECGGNNEKSHSETNPATADLDQVPQTPVTDRSILKASFEEPELPHIFVVISYATLPALLLRSYTACYAVLMAETTARSIPLSPHDNEERDQAREDLLAEAGLHPTSILYQRVLHGQCVQLADRADLLPNRHAVLEGRRRILTSSQRAG